VKPVIIEAAWLARPAFKADPYPFRGLPVVLR
jgi:hypothetical protein